jgi:ParB-like nuclease domain
MATTAPTAAAGLTLPLARIHVPENVRALNAEHVDALAASIALQGMLVPIVVCPAESDVAAAGYEYELVAGFHRVAAADKIGLADVPAVIRDSAGEQADRAVENITSCRFRHDVFNAHRDGMPTSVRWLLTTCGVRAWVCGHNAARVTESSFDGMCETRWEAPDPDVRLRRCWPISRRDGIAVLESCPLPHQTGRQVELEGS